MDIKIEAPGHENQQRLIEFYTEKLTKKYGKYPFVKEIRVKVTAKNNLTNVSLQLSPEGGAKVFASTEHENEHHAFVETIEKTNVQIEKYKAKHYHH